MYWLVGGAWPLAHHESFELVFGRKRERWLMRSVAALLFALGAGLLAERARPSPGLRTAAAVGAAGIGTIGGLEAARGRISLLYLLDGIVEWAFALAWLATSRAGRRAADYTGPIPVTRTSAPSPHATR